MVIEGRELRNKKEQEKRGYRSVHGDKKGGVGVGRKQEVEGREQDERDVWRDCSSISTYRRSSSYHIFNL